MSRDLRSRVRPEHTALLDLAAEAGEQIHTRANVADVLVQLGWLEQVEGETEFGAEFGDYRITPHGLRVHAKAHGRSLSTPTPAPELLSDSDSDEPEPFGCSPPTITRAPQADTWGLGR